MPRSGGKRVNGGEDRIEEMAELFRALGDHTRLRLLLLLTNKEMCVCDISELMGITPSAVSHQLRVLRGLRLVRGRRQGKHVYYQLADGCVDQLVRWGLIHAREAEIEQKVKKR